MYGNELLKSIKGEVINRLIKIILHFFKYVMICCKYLTGTFQTGIDGGINVDSASKRDQIIDVLRLGERLKNPTFFEIEGWKRIKFFQDTLKLFGFDSDSAKLTLEEVELPISIGNGEILSSLGHTHKSRVKTFLVWKSN